MNAVAPAYADVASIPAKFKFSSRRWEWTGGLPEVQTWRLSPHSKKGRRLKEEALHAECTWPSFACAPVCSSSEIGKSMVLQERHCTGRSTRLYLEQLQQVRFYGRQMTIGGRWNGGWFWEEERACGRCKWAPGERKNTKGRIKGGSGFVKAISGFSMTLLHVKHSAAFYVPIDVIWRRYLSSSTSVCTGRVGTEAEYGTTNLVRKRRMRQVCSSYHVEEAGDLDNSHRTDDDNCDEEEEKVDKLVVEESREDSLAMSTLDGNRAFVSAGSSDADSMDQKQQQEGKSGYGTKEPNIHCSSSDANMGQKEHGVREGVQSMDGTEVENENVMTTIQSFVSQEGKRRSSEGMQLRASAFQTTAKEAERRARRSAERVKALRATITSTSTSHFRAKAALYSPGQSKGGIVGSSFSSSSDKCQSVQVDDRSHLLKRGSGTSSWIALVGDHPPLSRQEETSLSGDVRDLQALLSKKDELAKRLGREPSDLEWAESEGISLCRLLARIGKGRAAKRRMVEANLKLVDSIAERFSGRGLSHNELCQEGVKGLLRSAEKYDSSKNVKFSTYSFDWIRQKIGNALRMYAKPVKIGRTAWDKMWMLLRRKQALSSAKGGQPVSLEEAAIGSGVSPSVVRALDLAWAKSVQLDVPLSTAPSHSHSSGNFSDRTFEGTLACMPAVDTCPWKAVDELLMRRELNEAVSQLGPCQREIIRLHFGLGGEQPHLKKDVGKELGVTYETVRTQEKHGLQQLKETWGLQLEPYLSESSCPPS